MGSKSRIAKYILPVMLANRTEGQWWVETFVGGGNVIDKVEGNRLGVDINPHVIDALVAIRDHVSELPRSREEFTEEDYGKLRERDDYRFKGYAGFAFSYGGKWLGGWARHSDARRDCVGEAYRNAVKQSPGLQGVGFMCLDYTRLLIPSNSLIYCDPPYEKTTSYRGGFDHAVFWQWCRGRAREGHTVFVSEYNAPEDFTCVWQKELINNMSKDAGGKYEVKMERLFMP